MNLSVKYLFAGGPGVPDDCAEEAKADGDPEYSGPAASGFKDESRGCGPKDTS